MSSAGVVPTLREVARTVHGTDHRAALRAIQTAQDALDTAKAHHLAQLERSADFELDGSSSVVAWARRHLRLEARHTRTLLAADATLRDLPLAADAAEAGAIRLEHVAMLTFGLKHIGHQVITDAQPWLLDVAETHDPTQLGRVVKALRAAVYPDQLDEDWIKGMAKHDVKLTTVPEGWHLSGFLNTLTGAKLKAVLESLSVPVEAGDDRTSADRRVDGLDKLLTSVLESGLPSSKGIVPQVSVIVGVETLNEAMTAAPDTAQPTGEPGHLVGFGPIGPDLLSYIACTGEMTPILCSGDDLEQAQILNVGTKFRLATLAQRKAVLARQNGICAGPGCTNTHLAMHHTTWWSRGGRTDLDGLAGYCTNCHSLIHRGLLQVEATGQGTFRLTTRDGTPIELTQRRTTTDELTRLRTAALQARQRRTTETPHPIQV